MNDSDKTIHIVPPKRIELAAVGVLALLGLFLLVATLNAFDNIGRAETPAMNTITVSGDGKVSRSPDIARVNFTVQNTAATVAAAQTKTTEQANKAIAYVEGQGIAKKDIKTLSYNVTPQYEYNRPCPAGSLCPEYYGGTPRITGYQVSHSIEVTIRDLDKVSALLAGLGEQNVQNIYGPSFALDNPDEARNEAREMAIEEARAEAKVLAKQLGVRIVRVVNFSEGGNYPIFYAKDMAYGMGGANAESAPAPQIPAGENEYSSSVSITYEIR